MPCDVQTELRRDNQCALGLEGSGEWTYDAFKLRGAEALEYLLQEDMPGDSPTRYSPTRYSPTCDSPTRNYSPDPRPARVAPADPQCTIEAAREPRGCCVYDDVDDSPLAAVHHAGEPGEPAAMATTASLTLALTTASLTLALLPVNILACMGLCLHLQATLHRIP